MQRKIWFFFSLIIVFAQIVSKFLTPKRTKIFITYSVKLECSKESSEGLLPLEMALLSKSTLEVFFSCMLIIGQAATSLLLSESRGFVPLYFFMTLQAVGCYVPVCVSVHYCMTEKEGGETKER